MEWQWWFLLILALVAIALSLRNRASLSVLRQQMQAFATLPYGHGDVIQTSAVRGVAVVFNPAKINNMEEVRAILTQAAIDAGYSEPYWFATSKEEPGEKQTRAALKMKPAVVVAIGGDGTVRAVASELSGTNTPLGIIPAGTGNLLARNLNLPLQSSLRDLASIAVTGRRRRIDVGRISAPSPSPQETSLIHSLGKNARPFVGEASFLVIAGIGFDAQVMNNADETLKANMGWAAYLVSGMKHLRRDKMQAHIFASTEENPHNNSQTQADNAIDTPILTTDESPHDTTIHATSAALHAYSYTGESSSQTEGETNSRTPGHSSPLKETITTPHGDTTTGVIEARSILFGNCAKLPAGLVLAPDARIDDGWLDVMIVDTKKGLVGWADLVRRISLQSLGIRKKMLPEVGSIKLKRMRSVHVHLNRPELVEADGDTLGYVLNIHARLDQGSLIVHVA